MIHMSAKMLVKSLLGELLLKSLLAISLVILVSIEVYHFIL